MPLSQAGRYTHECERGDALHAAGVEAQAAARAEAEDAAEAPAAKHAAPKPAAGGTGA